MMVSVMVMTKIAANETNEFLMKLTRPERNIRFMFNHIIVISL